MTDLPPLLSAELAGESMLPFAVVPSSYALWPRHSDISVPMLDRCYPKAQQI